MHSPPSLFLELLRRHWGFQAFRPLQLPIIQSAFQGCDTLAILPTGGGKSITFQIAGLARGGLSLVITPLIALMNDQVISLRDRGIRAAALHSATASTTPLQTLTNCIHGHYAFLYLAPERILTPLFQQHIHQLDIRLLVIDEAHCISQWGHDFRPAYRQIAQLRQLLPGVPAIALTASATPTGRQDIIRQLEMHPCNEFCAPFHRPNLIYGVRQYQDIPQAAHRMAQRIDGSGIVYTRSRRNAEQLALALQRLPGGAATYHAGLTPSTRAQRQDMWLQGKIRILIATNAFGMGIDKPNTRFVIHTDLPPSLEEYYQEAGRAGRDGQTAYAALFHNADTIRRAQWKLQQQLQDHQQLHNLYRQIPAFLRIPPSQYLQHAHPFHIDQFAAHCRLSPHQVRAILMRLQRYQALTLLSVDTKTLYIRLRSSFAAQQHFRAEDPLHEQLLRHLTVISHARPAGWHAYDLQRIARRLEIPPDTILDILHETQQRRLLEWTLPNTDTNIVLHADPARSLPFSPDIIEMENQLAAQRIQAMLGYIAPDLPCRAAYIANHFGFSTPPCGQCDRCRAKK